MDPNTSAQSVSTKALGLADQVINVPRTIANMGMLWKLLSAVALLLAVVSFMFVILYWLGKPAAMNWWLSPQLKLPSSASSSSTFFAGFKAGVDPTGVNNGVDTAVMDHPGASDQTQSWACSYNPADLGGLQALKNDTSASADSSTSGFRAGLSEDDLIKQANYA